MYNKKYSKKLQFISVVLILIFTMPLVSAEEAAGAEAETGVTITPESTAVETELREFQIDHIVDVGYLGSFVDGVGAPRAVLVLDRSNSMLREAPDTPGIPIANQALEFATKFVDAFYTAYGADGGEIAVVSFGTNAVAHDNYKFFPVEEKETIIGEIEYAYAYSLNKKAEVVEIVDDGGEIVIVDVEEIAVFEWNHVYDWDNWNKHDGTNIAAAFYQAKRTVEKAIAKETDVVPNAYSTVIMTDGVATEGGDVTEVDLLTPVEHNSNTIAAIAEAEELAMVSNINAVTYFGGLPWINTIEHENAVAWVAMDTMIQSVNNQVFNVLEMGAVSDEIADVMANLEYFGTDATVSEQLEPGFIVVESSIWPEPSSVSEDGRTIVWDVGVLEAVNYQYSYMTQVAPGYWLDGSYDENNNEVEVLVNRITLLEYTDLFGRVIQILLPEIRVFVNAVPEVEINVTYENIINEVVENQPLITEDFAHNIMVDIQGQSDITGYLVVEGKYLSKTELETAFNLESINETGMTAVVEESTKHITGKFQVVYVDPESEVEAAEYAEGEYEYHNDPDDTTDDGWYTIYAIDVEGRWSIINIKVVFILDGLI